MDQDAHRGLGRGGPGEREVRGLALQGGGGVRGERDGDAVDLVAPAVQPVESTTGDDESGIAPNRPLTMLAVVCEKSCRAGRAAGGAGAAVDRDDSAAARWPVPAPVSETLAIGAVPLLVTLMHFVVVAPGIRPPSVNSEVPWSHW